MSALGNARPILLAAALLLALAQLGCDPDPVPALPNPEPPVADDDVSEPDPNRVDPAPQPPDDDEGANTAEADSGSQSIRVAFPDATSLPIRSPLTETFALRERYLSGERIRRQVRFERRYTLSIDSGLTANAAGASETTREYLVTVGDAFAGRLQSATIDVRSDQRRIIPTADSRPRLSVELGPLHGQRFRCVARGDGFQCDDRDVFAEEDLLGVFPARQVMLPGGPTAVGEGWELTGTEAARFLGDPGADAAVRLQLEADDAEWEGSTCLRVAYTVSGTRPVELLGDELLAQIWGEGEYYLCPGDALIRHHRQERNLSVEGSVERSGRLTPVERTEHLILEETSTRSTGFGP